MARDGRGRQWPVWGVGLLIGVMVTGCRVTPGLVAPRLWTAVQTTTPEPVGRPHMNVPHRFQGDTAACGPSALWSVMTYHLGPGRVNFENLDKSLRPTRGTLNNTIGTMPGALAKAAGRYHLAASVTNKASTLQLRAMVDSGLPVIILGEWTDGKESDLHFVVVNGYEGATDADTTWIITDSLVETGSELRWSTRELMAFWDDIQLYGRTLPYQRAAVNVAPKPKANLIPEDNRSAWVRFLDSVLKSGTDVLRWLTAADGESVRAGQRHFR